MAASQTGMTTWFAGLDPGMQIDKKYHAFSRQNYRLKDTSKYVEGIKVSDILLGVNKAVTKYLQVLDCFSQLLV